MIAFDSSPADLVRLCRSEYGEVTPTQLMSQLLDPRLSLAELKYDGWWVILRIHNCSMEIITSGMAVHHKVDLVQSSYVGNAQVSTDDTILIAEWMWSTNWSQTHYSGEFKVHDILFYKGGNVSDQDYITRWSLASNAINKIFNSTGFNLLSMVNYYPIQDAPIIWEKYPDFEGLVLKSNDGFGKGQFGIKVKHIVERDFICVSMYEGGGSNKGKLGGIVAGRMQPDGTVKIICSIGGGLSKDQRRDFWKDKDKYIGKVFTAYAKGEFPGGALRHSGFKCWREDKLAEQCK